MHRNATDNYALDRRRSLRIAFALGLIGFAPLAFPQDDAEDEVFELSPFEVTSDENEGYRATSTLAGTRIRTELKDVGSAISVYTDEFLRDVGATDNSTLLQYTTNAEVGGTQGTYAGTGNGTDIGEETALLAPNSNNRVRGLSAAENTRDYFVSDIPWDGYNVSRVDIQRGANSILFGLGKPAGIINATLADASFQNDGKIGLRFGSYGSTRANFSVNKVLVEDVLAVRVAGLMDNQNYQQEPAFEDDTRAYVALRWEPKFSADDSMSTTIKVKYEDGDIESNRPRNVPPYDSVSPWFRSSSHEFGGMDKLLVDNLYDSWETVQSSSSDQYVPWVSGGPLNSQQPFWTIDGSSGQVSDVRAGWFNIGALNSDGTLRGPGDGLLGKRYSGPFLGIASLGSVADNLGLELNEYGQYRSMSITDPTLFDYNNVLIDGDTKGEWTNWDALNLDFAQTFLNDRLGYQLTYDKQDYNRGGESLLGWRPTIEVDILQNWEDLTANPNVGRPFVASSGAGSGSSYASEREYKRATLFAELQATDIFKNESFLTKLLGKHRFNAVYSEEDLSYENRSWRNAASDAAWDAGWTGGDGTTTAFDDRPPVSIIYLGDSLVSQNSASGAYIPGVQASDISLSSTGVYLFDPTWTANGVDPGAAWAGPTGAQATIFGDEPEGGWTQASNPANYVGWTERPINIINNSMGTNPNLLTSAKKDQRTTESIAATWQGFLWDGAIVPTLGWREDKLNSREVTAQKIIDQRSVLDLSPSAYAYPAYDPDKALREQSVSGGLVVHVNKLIPDENLPFNLSLTYNKSSNFEVGNIRSDLLGNPIDNPSGTSKDYGFLISTKDRKYSLRAVKYKSEINLASSTLDVGGLGSAIGNGLVWRNIFLYDLGGYDWSTRDQPSYRNRASNPYPVGGGNKYEVEQDSPEELALEDAMIGAWNEIQADLEAGGQFAGFLDAWNLGGIIPSSELALRSEYQANPGANSPSDPNTIFHYGSSVQKPANFAVTSDTVSEGYEFELTANPTENWRISFNASKTEAMNNNVGGDLINSFIDYLDEKLVGPAGDIVRWGGASNDIFGSIYAPWRANYVSMKLSEGTAVPELRKWRYNLVTNYTFTDGKFDGLGIGGSYRWQDKVGIGYPLVPQGDLFGFDIANPNYGPSEDFIDLWASYGMKLNDKIDWKIQLNIRNAFADDSLIPISVQPDNRTWAAARRAPVEEWFITNTFSF